MMKNVTRKICVVDLPKFDWASLIRGLSQEGHQGLIYGLKCDLLGKFGLEIDEVDGDVLYPSRTGVVGDFFFPDKETTVYLKVSGLESGKETKVDETTVFNDPGGAGDGLLTIEMGEISAMDREKGEALEILSQALGSCLRDQGLESGDIAWDGAESSVPVEPTFETEAVALPGGRDIELAGVFRDGKLDEFLDLFSQEEDAVVLGDFLDSLPNREETEYYIDKLFEIEFIQEEIVVYCKKTGSPTIRAKDRAALDLLSASGILCSCGKALKSEDVRRLVILPRENRLFLSKTWAARTFLLDLLEKMGYPADTIRTSGEKDGLEMIFVPAEGQSLIFALTAERLDEKSAKKIWSAVKDAKNLKLVLYGAEGVDDAAVVALGTRAGLESIVATIGNLDELSTKLVDALGAERIEGIKEVLGGFENQLAVDFLALTMLRIQ